MVRANSEDTKTGITKIGTPNFALLFAMIIFTLAQIAISSFGFNPSFKL